MKKWESHEIWEKRGNNFLLQIKHKPEPKWRIYKNCWYIYAYIYPDHPLFSQLNKSDDIYNNAAIDLPFHGGVTYFNYHERDGEVTSFVVGCDYMHYLDDDYGDMNEACIDHFQYDAQKLFDALSETNEVVA